MLYIRVDGNSQIGAGHIMRCISIAEALKDKGKVTIFITADDESARLIGSKGFGTLTLQTDWQDMEGELPILLPILRENAIETLLIDSYSVTDTYLKKVGEKVRTIYLDDLGEHCYPVDILINYNIYAQELEYDENYKKRVLPVPKLFLGCEYTPIRMEFQNAEGKVRRTVRDVMITTGGADVYNIAGQIIAALIAQGSKYHGVQFHVVSGTYNLNIDKLKILEKENLNIHIYQNVRHMSALMKKCDVAIAACGSTMYELAAMGLPTVCYYFADNQAKIAEAFGRKLSKNAGNYEENAELTINNILKGLDGYMESYELRSMACEAMMQMLDGDGASRIADQLVK